MSISTLRCAMAPWTDLAGRKPYEVGSQRRLRSLPRAPRGSQKGSLTGNPRGTLTTRMKSRRVWRRAWRPRQPGSGRGGYTCFVPHRTGRVCEIVRADFLWEELTDVLRTAGVVQPARAPHRVLLACVVAAACTLAAHAVAERAPEPSFERAPRPEQGSNPSHNALDVTWEVRLRLSEPDPTTCLAFRGRHCAEPRTDDFDADGYTRSEDCDDQDYFVRPGAQEARCNGVDEDCDGIDACPEDADDDGVAADVDCDDDDASRSPHAHEALCNGVDENCNGYDDCDRDGDGVSEPFDCDDANRDARPSGVDRSCDGVDQDCDGADCCDQDADGDGVSCASDCDDRNARVVPGRALEPFEQHGCVRRDLNCDGALDGLSCT